MSGKFVFFDQLKRVMGWCPDCKRTKAQAEQAYNFSNPAFMAGKAKKNSEKNPEFRISNVAFLANTSLLVFVFTIALNFILRAQDMRTQGISGSLVSLFVLNIFYYSLWLKSLDTAAIVADKFGVQLQAFRFRNFEIPYDEIEYVASHRLEKHSKAESVLLAIMGIALYGFVLYVAAIKNDWVGVRNGLLILIPMLPLLFFAERKNRLWKHDTRLYIKIKHKKWYEFTPYYSVVTDEARASELKSFIAAMQVKAEQTG